MGVVKNIIPAIASTNALVSASCVTECIKILSGCSKVMDNYMQYMGQTGVNSHTYKSERLDTCFVCSMNFSDWKVDNIKEIKLEDAIVKLKAEYNL